MKDIGSLILPGWTTRGNTTHGAQMAPPAGYRCVCVCMFALCARGFESNLLPLQQVDFQRPVVISQVATQGAKQMFQSQFVTQYVISYSTDRKKWFFYKGDSMDLWKVRGGGSVDHFCRRWQTQSDGELSRCDHPPPGLRRKPGSLRDKEKYSLPSGGWTIH